MALTQVSTNGIADGAVTANDLENSGVTAGTYGSSSAIPAITVDAKGRVTSATTSAIDSTSIANGTSNVSVSQNADTQVVNAGTQVALFQSDGPRFDDNIKAKFGTGSDLQIYHDGNHSRVADAGTGMLILQSDNGTGVLINKGTTENMAMFNVDGSVELYHDNSKKFETTSTGIDVTGTVTCDGLSSDGQVVVSSADVLIGNTSGPQLRLRDNNSTGDAANCWLRGENSAGTQIWYVGDTNADGAVELVNEQNNNLLFGTSGTWRNFVDANGHFQPYLNNTYDLGSTSRRWRNVYTNDLNLSNEGGTNDVDGTWGSWTIQEGEDDLFLLNRRNGKKYKFALTEVN